jgi:hypothetical protein
MFDIELSARLSVELSARPLEIPMDFVSFLSWHLDFAFRRFRPLQLFVFLCKYFWTSDLFLALQNELLAAG